MFMSFRLKLKINQEIIRFSLFPFPPAILFLLPLLLLIFFFFFFFFLFPLLPLSTHSCRRTRTYTLSIHQVRLNDGGIYKCGSKARFELTIVALPQCLRNNDRPSKENVKEHLECQVSSQVRPMLCWW